MFAVFTAVEVVTPLKIHMEHKNHQVEPNLHFWLFKNATEHHVKSNKCSEETYTNFMILVLHQVIPSYTKVEPS